ncbi:MAG: hypothetical protein R6T96_15145 [Longimicrobiales bacterium]
MVPWIVLFSSTLAYGAALTLLASRLTPLSLQGRVLRRKLFHVGVFSGAVPAQLLLGFWGVVLYGVTMGALVLVAVLRGEDASLHGVLFRGVEGEGRAAVLVPLGATALGGLLALLLVGDFAMVGYLTCGWGDPGGEMVGRRWGRTSWTRFLPGRIASHRSLEGSLGVLVLGFLGGWAALGVMGYGLMLALGGGLVAGSVGAVSEALSWKGTDNLWVQLLPSLASWWLLG